MRKSLYPLLLISAVLLTALLVSGGDGRAKDVTAEPGLGEVVFESYTVPLQGYQQTVTVNATEEELFDFLSKPNNLIYPHMHFREARPAMIIVGRVMRVSTRPPTSGAERGSPKKFRNTARPSKPNTMDGTAARLLIFTSIISVHRFFGANSSR